MRRLYDGGEHPLLAITSGTVRPRTCNRCSKCGRDNTPSNSASRSSLVSRWKWRRDAASKKLAGGPGQIRPDTRTLVSATTFTAGAPFGADCVYLRLNLVHRHWFVRIRPHLFHHLAKFQHWLIELNFTLDQPGQCLRIQQTLRLCFRRHRLRQIQLNRDAHNALNIAGASQSCQTLAGRADRGILSEIWGKKGAIGFVPPEGDGALCTSHFFLFDVQKDHIVPQYLDLIFRRSYLEDQLDAEARGTTGYAAVRPKHLLSCKIPLPPLSEQRRIVARIEELAEKINEAHGLRIQSTEECDALCRSILTHDKEAKRVPMRDLVKLHSPDVLVRPDVTYDFAGVYCFGRGVFKSGRKSGMEFAYPKLTRLRRNDFVYPKLMAWEGALGVVPPECDGCVVSTEFPVFEVIEDRVLPEVLDTYFRTPTIWPDLSGASSGTNVRRRRLNPQDFLNYKMPLPSRVTQAKLRNVRVAVDALKRLQTETETHTNSPSNKFFRIKAERLQ